MTPAISELPIIVIGAGPTGLATWRPRAAVSLQDVCGQTLIVREEGSSTRPLLETEFGRTLLRPHIGMSSARTTPSSEPWSRMSGSAFCLCP